MAYAAGIRYSPYFPGKNVTPGRGMKEIDNTPTLKVE